MKQPMGDNDIVNIPPWAINHTSENYIILKREPGNLAEKKTS